MFGRKKKQAAEAGGPTDQGLQPAAKTPSTSAASLGATLASTPRSEAKETSGDPKLAPASFLNADETGERVGKKRGFFNVLRRTLAEFLSDGCTDLAAGLTYFGVLALFPALIAILSVMGFLADAEGAIDKIVEVTAPLMSSGATEQVESILTNLAGSSGAGVALGIGLALALWSASGYVGAFSRAMNKIYGVQEGRPIWRVRPMQLAVTIFTVLAAVVSLLILIISGGFARSLGATLGLGDQSVMIWNYAKWPVLVLVVIMAVAVLYHFTPNVKLRKFRIVSVGSAFAILMLAAATVGFAFYVGNFGSYNQTYGSLAGVVVFLLWLWIVNNALLFGAELDAELERTRELYDGLEAERELQLELKSDKGVLKAKEKREKLYAKDRDVREEAHGPQRAADRPFSGRP